MEPLTSFFISSAHAQSAAQAPPQGGGFSFMIMLIIFVVFMYFAIWRPQNKRAKEQQNLLNSLAKGDEVMTMGGVLGKIGKINDQYLTLTIAQNVDIVVQKSSIVQVLPKGTIKSIE